MLLLFNKLYRVTMNNILSWYSMKCRIMKRNLYTYPCQICGHYVPHFYRIFRSQPSVEKFTVALLPHSSIQLLILFYWKYRWVLRGRSAREMYGLMFRICDRCDRKFLYLERLVICIYWGSVWIWPDATFWNCKTCAWLFIAQPQSTMIVNSRPTPNSNNAFRLLLYYSTHI
jgi:hypothetical protein